MTGKARTRSVILFAPSPYKFFFILRPFCLALFSFSERCGVTYALTSLRSLFYITLGTTIAAGLAYYMTQFGFWCNPSFFPTALWRISAFKCPFFPPLFFPSTGIGCSPAPYYLCRCTPPAFLITQLSSSHSPIITLPLFSLPFETPGSPRLAPPFPHCLFAIAQGTQTLIFLLPVPISVYLFVFLCW